jgi:hypothetical protein
MKVIHLEVIGKGTTAEQKLNACVFLLTFFIHLNCCVNNTPTATTKQSESQALYHIKLLDHVILI